MPKKTGAVLSKRKKALSEKISRDYISDTIKNGLLFDNNVDTYDPDLMDTADSKKSRSCKDWKREFDNALNTYIDDMANIINMDPQREALERIASKDNILIKFIKTKGYEIYLQNILLQLFAAQDERCIEYILTNHYTSVFGNAYKEFMKNNNDLKPKCYTIALQIMLQSLKERLYGKYKI